MLLSVPAASAQPALPVLSAASLHASPPVPGDCPHPCVTLVASSLLSRERMFCCRSCCPRALRLSPCAVPCAVWGTEGSVPTAPAPCGSLLTEASRDSSGSRSTLPSRLEFYCCTVAHIPRDFSFLYFFFVFCFFVDHGCGSLQVP